MTPNGTADHDDADESHNADNHDFDGDQDVDTGRDADTLRADQGASITAKVTRGTDTRDQEQWRIKGKGETAERAVAEFTESLKQLEAQECFDRLRQLNPEREVPTDSEQ